MSKNVAVFVDVANIFYAAKAGGVDIDYVTLLKAAIAGRDFVRAYAYTGLDPENENQRQFHNFLARSGYRVVSKDIRKYGDGRIKANLDIELVVDLMRLARNLDIAVVVSGDGDFAPAIRAVQEMGVRVEVISFRGNTSADLIEVADQFTDIAQIARVDKASARSGRRVAAEGDLSMTAVPEKETEGAPRRRRGRAAAERAVESEATSAGLPANLIVLPGERLSRAPEEEALEEEAEGEISATAEDGISEGGERRRRRRRGGRGRGRGRREEGRPDEQPVTADVGEEDEDEFEEPVPAQLPHHTFGSVWDSQLGVRSGPLPTSRAEVTDLDEEEEDLDEPEVPEYLLAERRQRQRGGRGRMARGGRQGAYQAALERERYGRSAGGFGGSRLAERPRQERRRGHAGGQRQPRPERTHAERRPTAGGQPATSGEPWSEVPAELEELLRAELARKATQAEPERAEQRPEERAEEGAAEPAEQPAAEAAKPKRATRTRAPRAASTAEQPAEGAPAEEEQATKPKRATRARAARPAADGAAEPAAEGEAEPAAEGEAEQEQPAAKPKRTTRPRARQTEAEPVPAGQPPASEAETKPVRRRRMKASEAPAED